MFRKMLINMAEALNCFIFKYCPHIDCGYWILACSNTVVTIHKEYLLRGDTKLSFCDIDRFVKAMLEKFCSSMSGRLCYRLTSPWQSILLPQYNKMLYVPSGHSQMTCFSVNCTHLFFAISGYYRICLAITDRKPCF